jgi:hypothetical protein
MSIEQFGESLLGDIRKRRQKEARRARKQAERQALLGLGVNIAAKIGNEMLANKTRDFLKKEEFLLGQQAQNKALDYTAQLNTHRSAIEQGGEEYSAGDTVGYAMYQLRPEFEARAKETLSNTYTNDLTTYDARVRQETQKLAEEWATDYKKAISLADEVSDKDSYESMVALHATKAKPTNIGGYVTRGISSLFGGKSQEEFEQEAFEAIADEMEDAEELNTFMSTFKSFGDMTRAYQFTKQIFPEKAFSPDRTKQIQETPDVQVVDGKIFVAKRIKTTDLITKDETETIKFETDEMNRPVPLVDTNDPEEALQKLFEQKMDDFNYGIRAQQVLTPEGFEGFMTQARRMGLKPESPDDLAEYEEVGKLFAAWLPGNTQNKADEQLQRELIDVTTTGIITTKIAGEQLKGSPAEQQKIIGDILYNVILGTELTMDKYKERKQPAAPVVRDFNDLMQGSFSTEYPYIAR